MYLFICEVESANEIVTTYRGNFPTEPCSQARPGKLCGRTIEQLFSNSALTPRMTSTDVAIDGDSNNSCNKSTVRWMYSQNLRRGIGRMAGLLLPARLGLA
jgi:hypothetical protein